LEVLLGLLIGFAIGATGIGGGTLAAPAMILLLGFSPRVAIATALVFSAIVKIGASGIYLWRKQVNFRALGYLLVGGVPGVLLGALLFAELHITKSDSWIPVVVGLFIIISAGSSLFRFSRLNVQGKSMFHLLPLFSLPIGLETGFSSAGAGALSSIVLLNVTDLSAASVVGTDLVFGMITAATGGTIHAFHGNCDWMALALLLPAGFVGTVAGAHFARALPSRQIRAALLCWIIFVGFLLIHSGLQQP